MNLDTRDSQIIYFTHKYRLSHSLSFSPSPSYCFPRKVAEGNEKSEVLNLG